MFGPVNSDLLPTFGRSDSTPSFSDFKFSTIGKEPSLLSRISDRRVDDNYSRSVTPMSSADFIAFPPETEADDGDSGLPLDRQSLLQALTNAEDHSIAMDTSGDQDSYKQDSHPLLSAAPLHQSESVIPTAPPSDIPAQTTIHPEPRLDISPLSDKSHLSPSLHLRYPSPQPSLPPPSEAKTSPESVAAHSQAVSEQLQFMETGTQRAQTSSPAPPIEISKKSLDAQKRPSNLEQQLLLFVSDLSARASVISPQLMPLTDVVTAFHLVEVQNTHMLSTARHEHALAKQCLESATQALNASEETLRVTEACHLRFTEALRQLESLKEAANSQSHSLQSLNGDLATLEDRIRDYAKSTANRIESGEQAPALVHRAISPIPLEPSNHPTMPATQPTAPVPDAAQDNDSETVDSVAKVRRMNPYEMFRLRYAPEAEADIARRAWEAQRSTSSTNVGNDSAAALSLPAPPDASHPISKSSSPLSTSSVPSPSLSSTPPERRSSRAVILSERVRNEPELVHSIFGDRLIQHTVELSSTDAAPVANASSSSPLIANAKLSSHGITSHHPVGNPIARTTLTSASPHRASSANLSSSNFNPISILSTPRIPSSFTPKSPSAPDAENMSLPASAFSARQASDIMRDSTFDFAQPIDLPPDPDAPKELPAAIVVPSMTPLARSPSLPPIASLPNVESSGSSSPPAPSSPTISPTREGSDLGNLPYDPTDVPNSFTAHFYNTKHILERHGKDWQQLATEVEKRQEQDALHASAPSTSPIDAVSTMAKVRNESKSMASRGTAPTVSQPVPTLTTVVVHKQKPPSTTPCPPRTIKSQSATSSTSKSTTLPSPTTSQPSPSGPRVIRSPASSSTQLAASPSNIRLSQRVPTKDNTTAVVNALNTGFDANGGIDTPPDHPIIFAGAGKPHHRLSPSSPVSAGQKRKIDDISLPHSNARNKQTTPAAYDGKRSRPDDRPGNRTGRGDHWSPPPPPPPSRRTFAQRISYSRPASDTYRPQYTNDEYASDDYTQPFSPDVERFDDDEPYGEPRDKPGLASRLSSSQPPSAQASRGRGKSRGGGGVPRARRGAPFRSRPSDSLESRITDAPLSLGDRIGR